MRTDAPTGTSVRDWLEGQAHRHHVSENDPSPVVMEHNLVVVARRPDEVRDLIRDWERIVEPDRAIGMFVLRRGDHEPSDAVERADRAFLRHGIGGALAGAVPGSLVGAVVIGGLAVAIEPELGSLLGGALGGAAFGAAVGGVLAFVIGSGWSSAYRESFVDPQADAVYVASFHARDSATVDLAELRVMERGVGRTHRFTGTDD